MRFKSLHCCLLFIGTLLLVVSILGGDSLNKRELNQLIGINKTVVTVKDEARSNDAVFFSIDNTDSLPSQEVTFTTTSRAKIDGKQVSVIGTDSKYPDFENMQFYSGGFFNKTAETSAEKVVVIDEPLAWDEFGSLNVVGNTLEMFDQEFRVIGVVAPDKSIITTLSDSGLNNAFIPLDTLLKMDKTTRINSLQIRNNDPGLNGQNYTDAENVLGKLDKNPEDYYISDFNKTTTLIEQKPRILVFIAGIATILVLLQAFISRGREVSKYIHRKCQDEYLNSTLKTNTAEMLKKSLIMVLLIIVIIWFWIKIRFTVYIPPEYLPQQLIDLKFYSDLFQKGINDSVVNQGYMASLAEIRLSSTRLLSNCLFYIALLIGLPITWMSLKLIKWEDDISLPRTLFVICIAFISATALGAVIMLLAGIPLNVNMTDLAVIFSFIYIYAIKYYKREMEGECFEETIVHHHGTGLDYS